MNAVREGELGAHTRFRPSRFFKEGGKWYFQTREGTTEGPFRDRHQAEDKLQIHLMIFKDLQLESVEPAFHAFIDKLKLEPIQMQWR